VHIIVAGAARRIEEGGARIGAGGGDRADAVLVQSALLSGGGGVDAARMRSPALLAVVALGLLAAGCGTSGPDASVRGTVDAFLFNCRRGNGPAAQELVVPSARAIFVAESGTTAGCARILGLDGGVDLRAAHVAGVAVDSELAEADLATPAGSRRLSLSFSREGWLIEGPH
jgi:hypothetical protein